MSSAPATRVSLSVSIRQALKAEDTRQLNFIIGNADLKTIATTAAELTSDEAAKILDNIGKAVTIDPARVGHVLVWVRELILSHTSYLSSQNRTRATLQVLLDTFNQRLHHHDEVVKMKQVTETILRNASEDASRAPEISTPTEPLVRWSLD